METSSGQGDATTGEGVLDVGPSNVVSADTTIGLAGTNTLTVNLDEGSWLIEENASLALHVAAIEADDLGFDGSLTIENAARLDVQLPSDEPWRFENGTLNYQGDATIETFLAGDPVEFKHQATIHVDGSGRIAARVDLGGAVQINDAGRQLELVGGDLNDPNRMTGGTIQGNGLLSLPGGKALVGYGEILVDAIGGGELRADDGNLSVHGVNGLSILGTADTDGVLELGETLNTFLDLTEALELRGGEVRGAVLVANQGLTRGHGRIATNEFGNSGTTEAFNGTLQLDTSLQVDIDGRTTHDGEGSILAVDGDVEVLADLSDSFSGELEIGPGRTFAVMRPGVVFRNAPANEDQDGSGHFGRINITGGQLTAESFEQASRLRILGTVPSTLDVGSMTFESGSFTEIVFATGELHLSGEATVEPGADIVGGGTLGNRTGSVLTLQHNATVDVPLRNAGELRIGNSPGRARVHDFEQTATGLLEIELGGLIAGTQYDQLALRPLSGIATLDGTLDVTLLGGFAPDAGDVFEILTAPGGVSGVFATESLPSLAAGLQWNVLYDPTAVLLEILAGFAADFDEDGDVDGNDFLIWQNGFGVTGGATHSDGDADGDGDVDGNDFLAWQTEFGMAVGGGGATTARVPEPATAVLLLLAVGGLSGCRPGTP